MTFAAWAIVFSIASVSYVITNFFYFFMISGEIQPWNYQQVKYQCQCTTVSGMNTFSA